MEKHDLEKLLNRKVKEYNQIRFIEKDPISVPHQFSKKQDIEIAGFFAAILAWGNRTSIINNANKIMRAMDNSPHDFILNHAETDLKKMLDIKHRTFNTTDLLYFIHFLNYHYTAHESLESAFLKSEEKSMKARLVAFHNYFFSIEHPQRTTKHISNPARNSACKRLNMYLRWMIRNDNCGVDFGIWNQIKKDELICPMDVHVCNVAYKLGLLKQNKANWNTAIELTNILKEFDKLDPCKYDFALFGLGVEEKLR